MAMTKLKAVGFAIVVSASVAVLLKYNKWFVYPGLRAHVTSSMKDPESTQFRNEKLSSKGWLCGELNSKNSYGAYAGFKRFVSNKHSIAYIEGIGRVSEATDRSSNLPFSEASKDDHAEALYLISVIDDLSKSGKKMSIVESDEGLLMRFEKRWDDVCK